ncbi:hypothetical protein BHM03_00039319 [Ensete ventricosum]|nr:hypothetical protein BHM03_00039319 [Ensete ventricosum]
MKTSHYPWTTSGQGIRSRVVKPKVWGWPVESCLCQTGIRRLARRCQRLHGSQSNSDEGVEDDNLYGSGIERGEKRKYLRPAVEEDEEEEEERSSGRRRRPEGWTRRIGGAREESRGFRAKRAWPAFPREKSDTFMARFNRGSCLTGLSRQDPVRDRCLNRPRLTASPIAHHMRHCDRIHIRIRSKFGEGVSEPETEMTEHSF